MQTLTLASPDEALSRQSLDRLAGEPLAAFLLPRRWFGAGGVVPRSARFASVVPVESGRFAVTRVEVEVEGGAGKRVYQVPLAFRRSDDRVPDDTHPAAVLARVEWSGGDGTIFDATEDPRFLRRLADLFARGESLPGDGVQWVIEPLPTTPLVVPARAPIRTTAAEQSNTSVVFAEAAILKLFRRLEPGEHPEVEVTRFLTIRAHFAHTPTLLGEIRFEHADGTVEVAGMLQEFVPRSRDAWADALASGAPYFRAPREKQPPHDFAADAGKLGTVTREMHEALAGDESDPAFAPEPATHDDVERWADEARRRIDDGLRLLERQLEARAVPDDRVPEARALARRRVDYLRWVDDLVHGIGDDAGFRIRLHGDYHLGQVLRTASGDFMIIDFEGEPLRPLAARRAKGSPLRDVAGMLRSLAYAAARLAADAGGQLDVATREIRAGRWERGARDAFIEGYLAAGEEVSHERAGGSEHDEPGTLPEDPENLSRLLSLFETEKAFYELAYELNHRPDWVWIPMRGISKLLVG